MPVCDMKGFRFAQPPVLATSDETLQPATTWARASDLLFTVAAPRVIRSDQGGKTFTVLYGKTLAFTAATASDVRTDVFSFYSDNSRLPNGATWVPAEPEEPLPPIGAFVCCLLSGHLQYNRNQPDLYHLDVNLGNARVVSASSVEWHPFWLKVMSIPDEGRLNLGTSKGDIVTAGRITVELMVDRRGAKGQFISHPHGAIPTMLAYRLAGDTELLHGGGQWSGPTWNSMAYGWAFQSMAWPGSPNLLCLQNANHFLDGLQYLGCYDDRQDLIEISYSASRAMGIKQTMDANQVASQGIVLACREKARSLGSRLFSVQAGTECYVSKDEPAAKRYGKVDPNGNHACWTIDAVTGLNSGGGLANAMYWDQADLTRKDPPGRRVRFPACAGLPADNPDQCGQASRGGFRQFPGWMYDMPWGACVKAKTDCVGCLDELARRGLAYDWNKMEYHYESCDANGETRLVPPRTVKFDECRNLPDYAHGKCVFDDASGQASFPGWQYQMPDGRCFKAKGTCAGCLQSVYDYRNAADINFIRSAFTECDGNNGPLQLAKQVVHFPECRDHEDPAKPCVMRENNQSKQFNEWRYLMPGGRCVEAKGNCTGCLDALLNINQPGRDSGGNKWALEHWDSFNNAFASCNSTLFEDTRYAKYADGVFDRTAPGGCNDSKYGDDRCAFYPSPHGGHEQLPGYNYRIKGVKGCFRASDTCDSCLDGIQRGNLSIEKMNEKFVSCSDQEDTRDISYNYDATTHTEPYPECALRELKKCTNRPIPGSENDDQRIGWQYVFPDGRCVQAKTGCNGCLNGLLKDGNQWAWMNEYSMAENFAPCDTYEHSDSQFAHPGGSEFDANFNGNGCNHTKYGTNRCAFPENGGHVGLIGFQYNIHGQEGCFKARKHCQGCLDAIQNGNLGIDKMYDAFASCHESIETRSTRYNKRANPNPVQQEYPYCATNGPIQDRCTERHPENSMDYQFPGWMYHFPDGRCVKAKVECLGCLNALLSDGNEYYLHNPDWLDAVFESCQTDFDTRHAGWTETNKPFSKTGDTCNHYSRGKNRCAFWDNNMFKQLRGYTYRIPNKPGYCLVSKTNCLGCLDAIEENRYDENLVNENFHVYRC